MAININNLGNNQVNTRQSTEQQVQQQNNQAANNAAAQKQAAAAPRQDSVSLTNSAQQMTNAHKKAQSSSGFDQDKVDKIKKAISEGNYKVDADKLAANILSSEGKMFGL